MAQCTLTGTLHEKASSAHMYATHEVRSPSDANNRAHVFLAVDPRAKSMGARAKFRTRAGDAPSPPQRRAARAVATTASPLHHSVAREAASLAGRRDEHCRRVKTRRAIIDVRLQRRARAAFCCYNAKSFRLPRARSSNARYFTASSRATHPAAQCEPQRRLTRAHRSSCAHRTSCARPSSSAIAVDLAPTH
jgi:hypothetical protein